MMVKKQGVVLASRSHSAGVMALALLLMARLWQAHETHLGKWVAVIEGILAGHPPWLAFQNRLLGPMVVKGLSFFPFVPDLTVAMLIFFVVALVVQQFVLFHCCSVASGNPKVGLWLTSVSTALAMIYVDAEWYYTWDVVDAIGFTLLAHLILIRASLSTFAWLALVWTLNRESALFVPFVLAVDALWRARIDVRRLVVAVALGAFTVTFVVLTRACMFVARQGGSPDGHPLGNHWLLKDNVYDLLKANFLNGKWMNSVFLLGALLLVALGWRGADRDWRLLAVLYVALSVNLLMFGIINEVRVFIPLFCLIVLMMAKWWRLKCVSP